MTLGEAYFELEKEFGLPKASVYEILTFLTNQDYDWVINHPTSILNESDEYQKIILGLKQNVPVAYLLKQKSFFGLPFVVDHRVLIPRAESEILIEQAKIYLTKNPQARILDLGTGSGVLGLTLKKLFPETEVYLSDLSSDALAVAKVNADGHQLAVQFLNGDFLVPVFQNQLKFDLIICNPPYIVIDDPDLEPSTKFEPKIALFAQENGLEFYHQLFANLPRLINNLQNFCLVMEFGWKQKPALEKLVANYLDFDHYDVQFQKDYSQKWRCIIISSR